MSHSTNLPTDHRPFIGRVGECARLQASLRARERLITIIGPSGMGKTRLAQQVARRLAPEFADFGGSWFCDLSAAQTKEDLLSTTAMVLEIPEIRRYQAEDLQVAHALANRGRLLLVLDNFESLEAGSAALVSSWLSAAPELQIIVTSLVSTGLEGESLFELGPLDAQEAIALYEQRATLNGTRDRTFLSGEQRAIGELVNRLDCLPLAIELAAARARVLPPRAMLSRIGDRFELLRRRHVGRHSSLEDALYCSWELLDHDERRVLSRASVFAGGFSLEAAEAILGEPGEERPAVLEILEALREKALVQLDTSEPPRFSLYESVHAFAARELEQSGEASGMMRRHASYFIERGEAWSIASNGPAGPAAIARLLADRENLVAVHRRNMEDSPELAVRAALAASVAFARTGAPSSELHLVEGAVRAARLAQVPSLLATALKLRSSTLSRHGKLEGGSRDLDEALALVQGAGLTALEGKIRSNRGRLLETLGRLDEAEAELKRALELEGRVEDPALAGGNRMGLALLASTRGIRSDARRNFEEACTIFREAGDLHNLGRALVNLAHVRLDEGDLDAARTALHEAGECFRLGMNPGAEADARLALGAVERIAGRLGKAEEHLTAALPIERLFGNRCFEGIALVNLGLVAFERGHLQLAQSRLREGFNLVRDAGEIGRAAEIQPYLGAVEAILGRHELAQAEFAAARAWFEGKADRENLALTDVLMAFLDLGQARVVACEDGEEAAAPHLARAIERQNRALEGSRTMHELHFAARVFESTVARYAESDPGQDSPDQVAAAEAGAPALLVGPDAAWFELEGQPRVKLGTRGGSRRLFQALVEQRLLAPGVGLCPEQLSEVGWPGESLHPSTAANRVYKGVNLLRKAGLDEVLLRYSDGYLLSAKIPVSRARL